MTEILPESIPLEFEGTPVQDVMVSKPICCRDTSTVADAVQLMVEHGIGGLPVVDDGGHVVGFVSDGDVMRCIAQHRAHSIFTGGDASMLYFDDQRLDERIADVKGRSVMDIATRKVVCSRPTRKHRPLCGDAFAAQVQDDAHRRRGRDPRRPCHAIDARSLRVQRHVLIASGSPLFIDCFSTLNEKEGRRARGHGGLLPSWPWKKVRYAWAVRRTRREGWRR